MSMAEELLKRFEELLEDKKRQVIDFVDFLRVKERRELSDMMDDIIEKNKFALKELS